MNHNSRRLRALLVAAIMGLVVPLSANNPRFGVVTVNYDPMHSQKTNALGAGSVRLGLDWFEIEPQQDQYNWATADTKMLEASANGKQVLATLAYSPLWAAQNGCGEDTEAGKPSSAHCFPWSVLDWQEFVFQVINRYNNIYGLTNITYGIWNEPNLHFLNDLPDASKWAQLFIYADGARTWADPNARLAGPETSHHAVISNNYFFNALYAAWVAGAVRPQDIITVHYYPDAQWTVGFYNTV